MKSFVAGDCRKENVFQLVDPTEFIEIDFEAEVVKALTCLLPDYSCGVFAGSFILDGDRRSADLALIHKSLSHWFVVEVELASHSLESHVLPQVRCFRYGEPENACVASLCAGFEDLDETSAHALLRVVPRSVAVIANRLDPTWEIALRGLDVQLLTVSVFRDFQGRTGHEVDGRLHVLRENLGFAQYSAPDKSLRIPKSCGLPLGLVQMEDPFGIAATWVVRESGNTLWITKEQGVPFFPHNGYVQVIRTFDGRISLRLSQAG